MDKIEEIKEQIRNIDKEIIALKNKQKNLRNEILNLQIAPLQIGGYCMTTIGHSKKLWKCRIEGEDGFLYLRPFKDDGKLSDQNFLYMRRDFSSLIPCSE